MYWKHKSWILIGLLFAALTATGVAQVATTQVADSIYHADGTVATGTALISWPAFTTSSGEFVPSGNTSATIAAGGALSVQLVPNAGATPIGSYYTVVYHLDDGSVSRQYWVVPQSAAPVKVTAIASTVLPTSVAMQTVSKSYVDTAIAAAVTGHPLDSTPYVLKAGDTMTGPLILPGDPVSATQAADKNYVDTTVAAISGGLGQKVATMPQATQTVTQPAGTQLQVNNLNGTLYADQYVTGRGDNGIANATASADCSNGCEVKATQDYTGESYSTAALNPQTHVEDARGGRRVDSYKDPLDVVGHGLSTAQTIDVVTTESEASIAQRTGNSIPGAMGLVITQRGLAGGSNLFPEQVEQPPYFKMGYSALMVNGIYNTQGQHVLVPEETDCYGVGDCLIGSRTIVASGGFRDSADEGTHPFDLQTHEDSRVFTGTCTSGCTPGATTVMIAPTAAAGTQGDGRFLIDTNSAHTIASAGTGGAIVGGSISGPHASVQFSGTNLPVSVFLSTGQAIVSQAKDIAPGTVTFPIATIGVPAGYATSTVAIGASSGLACVADQANGYAPNNYEMAPYTVIDDTHLRMTLNKPHTALSTLAFGGLCGYGLEQTIDTVGGIRQLFPIVGAYSSTGLYYAGGSTPVLGRMNQTSGFLNVNGPIASITRTANVVTATLASNLPADVNGLTLTIAGVADSSYNGSFVVTTTGANSLTYAQSGADSASSGGTASVLTGGFAFYPMAEVLSVYDSAARSIDGQMTLAPNNVAWAANDPVEEPHFYQEYVTADTEGLGQSVPRPTVTMRAGLQYQQNNGPGLVGWSIQNLSPTTNYLGYGGTHGFPDTAYEASGVWRRSMSLNAGEQAAFAIHCNLHGCGNWNSAYNLFELDSSAGTDVANYSPSSSSLSLNLRGTPYSFTPQAFNAGTINATTLNATTINGALSAGSISSGTVAAARLPLFGPSGGAHASGIVPDPGATAGNTRFLREDGTWSAPIGGDSVNFVGTWAGGTTFSAGQSVSYTPNGNSYVSLVNSNTGNQPDTSPAQWGLLASANPLTLSTVQTAINATSAHVTDTIAAYASSTSTPSTIGWTGLNGTDRVPHRNVFLGDPLPNGGWLEKIVMQLSAPGTVIVLVANFTPTGPNSPAGTPTILKQFTLDTATAASVSGSTYTWVTGANFEPIQAADSQTFVGINTDAMTAGAVNQTVSFNSSYYDMDCALASPCSMYHDGYNKLDLQVTARTFAAPVTPSFVATTAQTVAATAAAQSALLPMSYAAMNAGAMVTTGDATIPATQQGGWGQTVVASTTPVPQGAFVESITGHFTGTLTGTVTLYVGDMPGWVFTTVKVLTLSFANATQISPGVYQWVQGTGYAPFTADTANTYFAFIQNRGGNNVYLEASPTAANSLWAGDPLTSDPPGGTSNVYRGGYQWPALAFSYTARVVQTPMKFMGAWSSSTYYLAGQTITYAANGNTYTAIVGNTNQLPTNAAYWSVIATAPSVPSETRQLSSQAHKGIVLPHGGTPIAIFSVTGAGNVDRIQIADLYNNGSPTANQLAANTLINITIDGGVTQSAPLGMFMLWYGYSTPANANATGDLFESKYLGITAGTSSPPEEVSGFRRLFLKYNTSCVITLTNPDPTYDVTTYTQVEYYPGAAPAGLFPITRNVFHMITVDWATAPSLENYGTLTMLPSITGSGELESIYYASSGDAAAWINTPTWLESPPILVIDGARPYEFGGNEDFYGNQFYGTQFHGRADEYGIARYGLFGAPENSVFWSAYRYFRQSPMYFNSSLAITWQNPYPTAMKAGSLVVYYTEN